MRQSVGTLLVLAAGVMGAALDVMGEGTLSRPLEQQWDEMMLAGNHEGYIDGQLVKDVN